MKASPSDGRTAKIQKVMPREGQESGMPMGTMTKKAMTVKVMIMKPPHREIDICGVR